MFFFSHPSSKKRVSWRSRQLEGAVSHQSPSVVGTLKKKFLLDGGSFCWAAGILCFGLGMTLLPMSFKVRFNSSSPVLVFHLRIMIPRVADTNASNPESLVSEARTSIFRTSFPYYVNGPISTVRPA